MALCAPSAIDGFVFSCDSVHCTCLIPELQEVATKEIVDAAKSGNEDLVKKCVANKAKIDECTDEVIHLHDVHKGRKQTPSKIVHFDNTVRCTTFRFVSVGSCVIIFDVFPLIYSFLF